MKLNYTCQIFKNISFWCCSILMLVCAIPALPFLFLSDISNTMWLRGWSRIYVTK